MAATNIITVGNIEYHVYENLTVPDAVNSPKGSIGLVVVEGRVIGTWIAKGDGKWDQLLVDEAYGAMRSTENTTTYYDETYTQNSWYNTNALTWTAELVENMELQNGAELHVINNTIGRFLLEAAGTWYNGDSWAARYWNIEETIAKNNTIGAGYQGATPSLLGRGIIQTFRFEEMSAFRDDYINHGFRYTNAPGSGVGFNPRRIKIHAKLVDKPIILLGCDMEDDNHDIGRIHFVNGTQTNQWIRGTATTQRGTKSIYISNDGSSYAYNNTAASVSHVYYDLEFPNIPDTTWNFIWNWKGTAEATYDFLKVYLVPDTITPLAGTEISSAYLISGELSGQSTWQIAEYSNSNLAGTKQRLVFSWKNDSSVGTEPSAIDNIAVFGYVDFENVLTTLFSEDWESGDFTANGWTVVNGTQTNKWYVGSGTSYDGTYSAYVSNDSGVTPAYTITATSVVHFYKDFTLPSSGNIKLSFKWKAAAENGTAATYWDYGTVVITSTATTPVAGTEVITTQAIAPGFGRLGATANLGKFNLTSDWTTEEIDLTGWSGGTYRIVFTWKNDGSVGTNPPFCIDDITIKY